MTTGTVHLDEVDVRRGAELILEDIDETIGSGRLVGILGPNGAGKTTLLESIHGLLSPDDGSIALDGRRVTAMSRRQLGRTAALVPQTSELSFDFGVRDVVEMGRYPHRARFGPPEDGDRVDAALERAEAEELTDRTIGSLSAGERRRVLLARALAQDTPIVLVDEPTAALDIRHTDRVMRLLRDLVEDGRTVIAAIHDLQVAGRYCDALALLRDGSVRARGPSDAVLDGAILEDVYDVDVTVVSHPVTDTPLVVPHEREPTGATVHVLGHGPEAASAVFEAWCAGHAVTAGPSPGGGSLADVMDTLGMECVVYPPIRGLDGGSERRAADMIAAADAVVGVSMTEGLIDSFEGTLRRHDAVFRRETTDRRRPRQPGGSHGVDAGNDGDDGHGLGRWRDVVDGVVTDVAGVSPPDGETADRALLRERGPGAGE